MKHSPSTYANALKLVLDKTPVEQLDIVLKNFTAVLMRNGDWSQSEKVIESLEGILIREGGGRIVTLETARPLPEAGLKSLKEKFLERDSFRLKINPLLVAGVRVTVDGNKELDLSFARRLNNLFK